jgi:O-antigen/teichoic acid export membrane protein
VAAPATTVTGSGGVRGQKTVVGDLASMFGSRVVSLVLSFASVLITTRLLHPVGYGRVAYFTVVAMLIFTVTSGWTSTAVARYGREELEREGRLAGTNWSRTLIMAPLFAVAILIVPVLKLAGAFPPEFTWLFVWLVVGYGGAMVVTEHIRYLLEASGRMKLSALGTVCQQAGFVLAIAIVAVSGLPRTPLSVIVISLAALTGVAFVFGRAVWRVALWPPRPDPDLKRRMLHFSLPLIAFTVSQYVIQAVDLIVIRAFKSPEQVGVYAFAYQAFTTVQALATVAPQVLTPLFVSARSAHRERLVTRYFERIVPQVTFAASALAGLLVPTLVFVVPALFGEGFRGATEPLAVLLVALLILLVSNLLAPVIVLYERTRPVAVLNAVAAVVNVGGDILLLGPLHAGTVAAAYATAAGFAIIGAGYFFLARECLESAVRPRPELLLPAVAGLAAVVALDGAAALAAGITASATVSALILMRGRLFAREDVELIERMSMPPRARRILGRAVAAVAR